MPNTPSIDFLERRALAFCLAGRLTAWPDDASIDGARALADGLGDGDELEKHLVQLARAADRKVMEPAYIELFENGPQRCPLHETEYGRMRGLSKGNDLADIEGFYRAFGLGHEGGGQAMGDHLGAELEFYGALLAKWADAQERGDTEGEEIIAHASGLFLAEHLGRFAGAVSRQPAVAAHPLYGPLLSVAAQLVETECQRQAVTPHSLDLFAESAEPEGLCCGATVSPVPAANAER